jgi:hypothetical protein
MAILCLGSGGNGGKEFSPKPIWSSDDRIGDVVAAALHLTHSEYRYLNESC